MSKNKAYLAVGSNKGNKIKYLSDALKSIALLNKTFIDAFSSVYETKPFGFTEQDNFFNMAVEISTDQEPMELLNSIKKIENKLGRTTSVKWGPREIDIDILLFNKIILETDKLVIPHRYLLERDFFLVPLLELNNELTYPITQKKLKDYLNLIETNHIINKFNINSFPR